MSVVNVKVAFIRPKYANLREWRADPQNVYIGRRGVVFVDGRRYPESDSPFANPFKISKSVSGETVLVNFEEYMRDRLKAEKEKGQTGLLDSLLDLKGKTLGCWCAPEGCHGHVLLRLISEFSSKRSATVTGAEGKDRLNRAPGLPRTEEGHSSGAAASGSGQRPSIMIQSNMESQSEAGGKDVEEGKKKRKMEEIRQSEHAEAEADGKRQRKERDSEFGDESDAESQQKQTSPRQDTKAGR
uniref:DUF4326 domain-containing protein n=1 Tax=Chromera velia CCMP2878 TaxID=1169474 RepID=A0A0G4GIR3_9ALVE|mmetsp:Transcript_7887/g.15359  ORF Transcript_7887/g.15359 Transcript_7887/m.15359 type:complete len:242 (+) Transcript_7887:262-987(+)|eukprot:Cvel_22063.t1-p1 / transcript=Cvel_22063.t1 / gene=Cvel_22063 / organism=Chromera_velia_CCMP2878 / gene_product=hypothetical protein / transcript_product=hypothetical protein / location=Cvel_scaffold2131:7348-8070(-) / protein_length=241 / sequence_SO=supercontig / SO=protein_coding / is_pseudo=false